MIETMQLYYLTLSVHHHSIVMHNIVHLYDTTAATEIPAEVTSMYTFERLVSLYNRILHDKANPEENLSDNIDVKNGLLNALYDSHSTAIGGELKQLPKSLQKLIGIEDAIRDIVRPT